MNGYTMPRAAHPSDAPRPVFTPDLIAMPLARAAAVRLQETRHAPLEDDVMLQLCARAGTLLTNGDLPEFHGVVNMLARHGHFDAVDALARRAAGVEFGA